MRSCWGVTKSGSEAGGIQRAEDFAVVEIGDFLFEIEVGVEEDCLVGTLIDVARAFEVLPVKHEAERDQVAIVALVDGERGERAEEQRIEVENRVLKIGIASHVADFILPMDDGFAVPAAEPSLAAQAAGP
jgi:cell division septation protein DedD